MNFKQCCLHGLHGLILHLRTLAAPAQQPIKRKQCAQKPSLLPARLFEPAFQSQHPKMEHATASARSEP